MSGSGILHVERRSNNKPHMCTPPQVTSGRNRSFLWPAFLFVCLAGHHLFLRMVNIEHGKHNTKGQ